MKTIVSLTSFPAAIKYAENAIKSILQGTILPDKIILYLTAEQFPNREFPVLGVDDGRFEVRWCEENIRSYTKLVPALKDFPDDIIITIDDDIFYNKKLVEELLIWHFFMPNAIFAHRAKRIKLGAPYRKWRKYRWYHFLFKQIHDNVLNMQTGVGGVLYPPQSLDMQMIDSQLFMDVAPTQDDIYFWAAAAAKGTPVIPVPFGKNKPKGLGKPRELSLKKINFKSGEDRNSAALRKILIKFPAVKKRVEK